MDNEILQEYDALPDAERVSEGLRETGYTFNTAIADIVDNSIAANATKVELTLNQEPSGKITVYVMDNGCGMDKVGLVNALTYGSAKRKDPSSLGKFGLGLKTSATSFCRTISLISRTSGDNTIRKMQWDIDKAPVKGWKVQEYAPTEEEIDLLEDITDGGSGTVVVCENCDKIIKSYKDHSTEKAAFTKKKNDLEFHLSLVFGRFLDPSFTDAKTVSITLNGKALDAWDPFCKNNPKTLAYKPTELVVDTPNKKTATCIITNYIIPRRDEFDTPAERDNAHISNDMQGFYIYREHRLIYYGQWLGMWSNEPHYSLHRVEFSFNHTLDEEFNVDIKKSVVTLNDEIYQIIKEQLLSAPRKQARKRYDTGVSKKVDKTSANAHDASNKNIENNAPMAEKAKVVITGQNQVSLTNANGTFKHAIEVEAPDSIKKNQRRIIPVDSLLGNQLWEPVIVPPNEHAIKINTSHDYYKKIYYPLLGQNVMISGLDALLWSLAEAELTATNDNTSEAFEDLRTWTSMILKRMLKDLPEPDLDDND